MQFVVPWNGQKGRESAVSQVRSMVYPLIRLFDALGGLFGDLSRPQLRLMIKLTEDPPTISELAERLNISSAALQ